MKHNRLIEIINAYGTHSEKWPYDERASAIELLKRDLKAQALIDSVRKLDLILDEYQVLARPNLSAKILNNLPKKFWLDQFIDWIVPSIDNFISYAWRLVLAGSLPLIVGLIVGKSLATTETLDSWEDEIFLVSLATSDTGESYEQ